MSANVNQFSVFVFYFIFWFLFSSEISHVAPFCHFSNRLGDTAPAASHHELWHLEASRHRHRCRRQAMPKQATHQQILQETSSSSAGATLANYRTHHGSTKLLLQPHHELCGWVPRPRSLPRLPRSRTGPLSSQLLNPGKTSSPCISRRHRCNADHVLAPGQSKTTSLTYMWLRM